MPRAMDSSAARMVRMSSCISPPSRPADSAACRKVSKCSLTWSKAPRAGRQKTSRVSKPLYQYNSKRAARNGRPRCFCPIVFREAFDSESSSRRFFFGCRHGVEKSEELFHPRDFQRAPHSVTHANQSQPALGILPSDVSSNQSPDPRRIGIRHVAEVNNQQLRIIGAHGGLKLEHGGEDQRPGKGQNSLSRLRSGLIGDVERLSLHGRMVTSR